MSGLPFQNIPTRSTWSAVVVPNLRVIRIGSKLNVLISIVLVNKGHARLNKGLGPQQE